MKKLIVFLLCIVMVLSTMAVPAMAAYTIDELFPQRVAPIATNAQQNPDAVYKCLDNTTSSSYYMTYWSSKMNDDIPELTFTFANATISELWVRNGNYASDSHYKNNGRPKEIEVVYVTSSGNKHYTYSMIDKYDVKTVNNSWKSGYQKLAIPEVMYGVSEIRIYVPHYYVGSGSDSKHNININEIVFVGSNDPNYVPPTAAPTRVPTPTPVPTPIPTPTPTPVPTPIPTPVPTPVPTRVPTPTPYVPAQNISALLNQPAVGYAGPGIFYEELGTFLNAGYTVTAVSRSWDDIFATWWVQVEFRNLDNTMVRAYVDSACLNMDINQLPVEAVLRMNQTLMNDCWAYRGPIPNVFARYPNQIPRNTVTQVFADQNGFSLIEIYDMTAFKSVRVWVPTALLQ